ncbi:ABC transporter ATP-binding protein [Candidatus Uhrbacteria bacterium CG10_big_fil_rev_8_21_14_0_10_48_11]|uniref:ABC transporter ATP-binding protein n=1 Tax=Candidatus Uhrbacteria bacterium CG10_big_fil_rev_8_21_14_0_10_48_11 TaxID=1975037 RepID=A0A2M8LE04_9BACT|nr:MAG: ABC transporter ATP-binding protein [Candidatus Uhrbacteria bacterium CG10_big_fil_rev_8_21_14_0_10_48_11]
MEALDVQHLKKVYDGMTAVDDISFSVHEGEFFGFLGPNGAGKTTTIGAAVGLVNPTSGTVSVFGHDVVKDYRKTRALIGLSPQEFNVDMFRHAWETLINNAGYFGVQRAVARERAERLLKRFGLWEHRFKRFQSLSGGMKRRVLLARALIHQPKLLILDEPTAGVDVELRHWLWKELKTIQKQGTTILLTTHYLEEAEQLCERVAMITHGKIALIENTADLIKRYGGHKKLEEIYLQITGSDTTEDGNAPAV